MLAQEKITYRFEFVDGEKLIVSNLREYIKPGFKDKPQEVGIITRALAVYGSITKVSVL